jgi:hypothetical protein
MTCLAELLTISNNLWYKFTLFMLQYKWQSLLSIKQYIIMIMNDEVRLSKHGRWTKWRGETRNTTTDVTPQKHRHSCLTISRNHHVFINNCGKLVPNFKKTGHTAQKLRGEENILKRQERKERRVV